MRKRNKEVVIWFTEDELMALDDKVERTGLTRSSFLRKVLLEQEIKERPPVDFFETLKNLRQINNNLNQIAWRTNGTGQVDDAYYRENVEYLRKTINNLFRQYFLEKG